MHQGQHHPKIDSLPLPARCPLPARFPPRSRFSFHGGCCCTQLSTFPQLPVNHWIESQLPSRLPRNWPLPSTPPISLGHSLQVHLQTRSIMALWCISQLTQSLSPIASPTSLDHGLKVHHHTCLSTASQCITTLARSQPLSASLSTLDLGLEVHLQPPSITASLCITKLSLCQPPSASLSLLDLGLQVHLSTRSIMASKYIVNVRSWVYGYTGVMEVDWAMGGT